MFTRTMHYQFLKLEQSVILVESKKGDLDIIALVPNISYQAWAEGKDEKIDPVIIYQATRELKGVAEVWQQQPASEIVATQIVELMKVDRHLFINRVIHAHEWGLLDGSDIPF